jgi:hypothetical protein
MAVKKRRTGPGRVLGVKQKIDGRKDDRTASLRNESRPGLASFRWLRFLPVHGAANITSAIVV